MSAPTTTQAHRVPIEPDDASTLLLDPRELADGDLERWRFLADTALEPNPFYDPAFVLPAVAHLRKDTAGLRLLVVAGKSGEWLACLPIKPIRWRRALPAYAAWNGAYTFLSTPLLGPTAPVDTLVRLLDAVPPRSLGQVLVIENMTGDGPVAAALAEAILSTDLEILDSEISERALLKRNKDEDQYLAHISPHHRRENNRRQRRLGEEIGGELVDVNRAGHPDAVGTFLALERSGWKGDAGTAIAQRRSDADFFREMCDNFAAGGKLDLRMLEVNDEAVASECTLITGNGAFTFKIAFDHELSRFSPGISLIWRFTAWFHQSGLSWADSCADPGNKMINRLWPDRRRINTIVLARSGPRGYLAAATLRAANLVRRLVRRRPGANGRTVTSENQVKGNK